jgi:YidC/Oxa1 family membrane protein insertase
MNDSRSLLAIVVCVLFYITYMQYLQNKYPDYGTPDVVEETPAPSPDQQEQAPKVATPSQEQLTQPIESGEAKPLNQALTNDVLRLNQNGFEFSGIHLLDYHQDARKKDPMPLGSIRIEPHLADLVVTQLENIANGQRLIARNNVFQLTQESELNVGYGIRIKTRIQNISPSLQKLEFGYKATTIGEPEGGGSFFFPTPGQHQKAFVASVSGSRSAEMIQSVCDKEQGATFLEGKKSALDFIGIDKHYFLKLLSPTQPGYDYSMQLVDSKNCIVTALMSQDFGQLQSQEEIEVSYNLYLGPKETKALAQTDPRLVEAIDLGWFALIAKPLLYVIQWIYSLVGNYGIAIILLTLMLKILFYPLTKAASISMKNMQKFTPEMNRIKEKYKDDRQRQQKELMAFMGKHKINPAKGCLPILPQIPVFIAFYNVLSQAIELRHASFFGWIKDLSAHDPYYVTPILLGAAFFLQQRLTPMPNMDETQKKIMQYMPLIFAVMMMSLPSGMVLYMLANTLISIAQQQWLNKTLGLKT